MTEPVLRQKSFQERERERIIAEYDKLHPKPQPEIEDSDDPRFFMDGDEIREFEKEKLAAEEGRTWHDTAQSTREKLYAKHSAPEEVDSSDDPPDPDEAMADFRAQHPEISDSDWKIINSPAYYTKAPDVVELQQKLRGRYSRADLDAILARAEDHLEAHKTEQARRAAYRKAVEQRFRTRGM